jgi:hypothetical protein
MDKNTELKPEVMKYMVSSEFDDTVVMVGNKFGLNVNQIGNLISIIKDYIYGNIKKEDLVGEISEAAEIDVETVNKMLPDINTQVLDPLKTRILMSYNYEQPAEDKTPNNPTPAPSIDVNQENKGETPTPEHHELIVVNSNLKESNVSTVKSSNYTVDPYREPLN